MGKWKLKSWVAALFIPGILGAVVLLGFGVLVAELLKDGFKSAKQKRELQAREDHAEIAEACIALARAVTNDVLFTQPFGSNFPTVLRSLSPRHITTGTNYVELEFHGGFDHYGYRVGQSNDDPKEWKMFFYTEQGQRLLTNIRTD